MTAADVAPATGAPAPTPARPRFERVAIIGIGLIGSSLARLMKRDGLAGHIAVSARTHATLDKAKALGLADSSTTDPRQVVDQADLIVLCAPLGAYPAIAEAMAPGLKAGAIVTDVGSAKQCVITDVGPFLPTGVHFVPGHPVAGTEHSGPEAAFEIKHRGEILRRCLTRLSREHREIIDLVYYHEKSVQEVAQIVGIPGNTVKTRMFYARRKLSELLEAEGVVGAWS